MKNYTDVSKSEHYMMKILKTKPSDNDQIKGLAEDLLCQIKRMNTDDTITDLLMS